MKKFTAIIILSICLMLIYSSCTDEKSTITGLCLITFDGSYIIMDDNGNPLIMSNQSKNEALFENLQNGDKIKITHSNGVLLTYPGQIGVYSCEIIEKGSIEDIPQDIYDKRWFTGRSE